MKVKDTDSDIEIQVRFTALTTYKVMSDSLLFYLLAREVERHPDIKLEVEALLESVSDRFVVQSVERLRNAIYSGLADCKDEQEVISAIDTLILLHKTETEKSVAAFLKSVKSITQG